MMKRIINEDFSDFPLEEFPFDKDHSALGEYHYYLPKGYTGNFYDPISLHQWRNLGGSWMVTEEDGKYYMEQNRGDNTSGHFKDVSAILVHKEELYSTYELEVEIRLFETKNECGVCFNYIHNRHYHALVLDGTYIKLIRKNDSIKEVLWEMPYSVNSFKTSKLSLKFGTNLAIYLDDDLLTTRDIPFISKTKVALIGKSACRFSNLFLDMTDDNYKIQILKKDEEEKRLAKKQANYANIEVIKKINLAHFGSGRQLRIGRLSDGRVVFILAQHQKRMYRDAFARLSSLTAFDINGQVLWQVGHPHNVVENTLISCDLPFQIADVNGDGIDEVIYARDFYVYIAALETGAILAKMETPRVKDDPLFKDYPYDNLNPDGLRVADFEGVGYKGNFILKDRYHNVFVYRASDFKLLWRYNHKNTGHFPYIYDFNQDGKDEMLVGYDMVSSDGKILWSLPINSDHTDEIIFAKTNNDEARFYLASGNEGFNIVNSDGTIFKHNDVGHAQRISISSYDKTKDDLQVAVTSFWGADHLVYLFDSFGNKLKEKELLGNGNLVSPVAYDGENELILMNTSKDGGLFDANLDPVVLFPCDGHPEICSEVYDIDGDGVDEIITWDLKEMWIYKASMFKVGTDYEKYPDDGFSNYRGEFLIKNPHYKMKKA